MEFLVRRYVTSLLTYYFFTDHSHSRAKLSPFHLLLSVFSNMRLFFKNSVLFKGDKGDPGIDGPKGRKGEKGMQGFSGASGPKGYKGSIGPSVRFTDITGCHCVRIQNQM